MKKSHAILLVLTSVALSHALTPAIAWAQFKVQSAGLSITSASGLSGEGTASSPLACTAAGASAAGCVTTGTQTIAGAKTLSGTLTSSVASGSTAISIVQGSFLDLKADGTNKIYSSASNNFIIHPQSSKNVYVDIGSGTGAFLFNPDNAVDIGSTGAARPKNVYVAGTIAAEGASGNVLTAVGGGYARFTFNAGAPTGTDCDAAGESGRIAIDTANNRFYFCNGAAWQYANEDVP